jgi:hypothetical protein
MYPQIFTIYQTATPFFVTLAQQGFLDYPLFGLSLTRNTSGTLSIGILHHLRDCISFYTMPSFPGAVDSSVVTNASLIHWNNVAEFSPFGVESNVSSYLQWAIPMSSFGVRPCFLRPHLTFISLQANGTQIIPQPTYANLTQNYSLALFDMSVALPSRVGYTYIYLWQRSLWCVWSIPRCKLSF